MRIRDPNTGKSFIQKRRRRCDEADQARELTFSCYRRYLFLSRDRTRRWFLEALQETRSLWPIDLWAYVLMPEHVHLLVYPREPGTIISGFLSDVKEPIAREAIDYLRKHAPDWLPRIRVREGSRVRHRFWQPGGGYDRNIEGGSALRHVMDISM